MVLRRSLLLAASWAGLAAHAHADGDTNDDDLVRRMIGRAAVLSPLVHLQMPPVFGNGYSVPLTLTIDSPMTETEHVRMVHVLAPQNPIILAARFQFTPRSGRAAISTRIRLAEPQNVLAVAEMSDGALLMARTWVKVDTNGCA